MEESEDSTDDVLDRQVEDAVAAATTAAMESSQSIPLLRLVITGFVLTLGIVLALQVGHRISTHGTLAPDGTPPGWPPHGATVLCNRGCPTRRHVGRSSPSTPSASAGPSRLLQGCRQARN